MPSELPPHEFQNQVLSELRQINTRLDKLEADIKKVEMDVQKLEADVKELRVELNAYQKGLDGMVRMSTTIVITAGAAVIFAPAIASLIKP